jgi:PAS domain S-box-containing protein
MRLQLVNPTALGLNPATLYSRMKKLGIQVQLYSAGMSPADQEPSSAADLGSRLEFETMLAELSSRFINLAPGDVGREIEDAMRRVCELLGIDVAVLWQWSAADADVVAPTHVHPRRETSQPFGPLSQESYPWVVAQMQAGRVVMFSSLEEMPPEADVDRESARSTGIKSNLTLPLAVGGERPVGALAFNTLNVEREWSDAVVKRLQLVAQVATYALARKRADQALRESEETGRATFDQAAVGIAHVRIDGRWIRVNDKLCAIVGYPREELLRMTFQDITHPADLATDLDHVRQILSGEIKTYSMEKRYIRKDHSIVWANLTVSLALTTAGEPRHFISVVEDITERRRAEEALRASEARLEAGADLAGLAFYEADFVTGTMFVDARIRDICGIPPERNEGLQPLEFWMEHLHPDDRQRVQDTREQMQTGALDRISIEYRYLHPTRGERWIHHARRAAACDAAGRPIRTLGVLRDVTDLKRAEDELRSLSRRLIRAHEEERALLARELHDDVTQRLAVMAIDVGRAEIAAAGGTQAETMKAVRESLVRLSEDIHSLAYQLHPSVLEELGLAEALRTECERRGRQSGIDIFPDFDSALSEVGPDAALCLYRVAQESLSNVIRHAQARSASVVLRRVDDGLLLAVRDDGIGFDPALRRQERSLGLASMRERLQLVNGTLDIESVPGQGTAIVAWVPAEGASS